MLQSVETNVDFAPWPSFDQEQIDAVSAILASGKVNYWTGTEGRKFEEEFSKFVGSKHAVVMANGTLTLEAALNALNIGPGDEVIVTPRTFMASVSTVIQAGAIPIFADINRRTGNLDPDDVAAKLTTKTKAILPVHLGGWPCDLDAFKALCKQHNLFLIEDCAQAHGAKYKGKSVGSFGEISSWSFCQDKIMTTGGEGGMVTTNDEELWKTMWYLKDHGKDYDAVYNRQHDPGFRWLHEHFGSNWRLTEMQSAIGRIQLQRMPEWHRQRTHHAETIMKGLAGLDAIRVEWPAEHEIHAYYKLYVYLRPEAVKEGFTRQRIVGEVESRGVPCFSGSCSEVYLEKSIQDAGLAPAQRLPAAQELGETSIMFQVHPTLSDQAIARTIDVFRDVILAATR